MTPLRCRNGHDGPRYKSGRCAPCHLAACRKANTKARRAKGVPVRPVIADRTAYMREYMRAYRAEGRQ